MRWILPTGAGSAPGPAVGAAVAGYGTSGGDLVVQGWCSGLGIGAAVTALWPLGWTVTRLAGVSAEDRFAVFGATAALTVTALLGLVLLAVLPGRDGLQGWLGAGGASGTSSASSSA